MLRTRKLTLLVLLAMLLTGAVPGAAATAPAGGATPRSLNLPAASRNDTIVVASGDDGVTFDIRVDWAQLELTPVTVSGAGYVRVTLPGWDAGGEPGHPALPRRAQMVGVPFGPPVTVRVTPGAGHTLALGAPVLPVETVEAQWEPATAALPRPAVLLKTDPAVYGAAVAYPRQMATVAADGVMRSQRVVGIAICPLQYDPRTQSLTVYESLRIEVAFAGAMLSSLATPVAESSPYEALLRDELLNYDRAKGWRRHLTPNPSPEAIASSSAEGQGAQDSLSSAESLSSDSGQAAEGAVSWSPPDPGWRVKVRQDGFYKLTYSELEDAGMPVDSVNPRTFRMYSLGSEVAIYVEGESDNIFDSTDYVIFYGQAIDSKYTWDNIYWLTYDPAEVVQGLRMTTRDGAPGEADTPAYYTAHARLEERINYTFRAPGDENLDRWLWNYVYASVVPSRTYTLTLTAPYTGPEPQAELRVRMLGALDDAFSPDHHLTFSVNGVAVDEARWDGITWRTVELPFASNVLKAGDNLIVVAAPDDTGAGGNAAYMDWIEVDYANTFLAEGHELPFGYSTTGTLKFHVDGFSSDLLAVYDVTNPAQVVRMLNVAPLGSATVWAAEFADTLAGTAQYWALEDSAYHVLQVEPGQKDQDIERDTASNLGATSNQAQHIVVTHAKFRDQAAQLVAHRNSHGLLSVLVDVQDVYDEFGYGIVSPVAIHDFLAYAYASWKGAGNASPPSYVVLVGDGHYDPKNYAGSGKPNYIPPYLGPVDPWIVETAGDNRYVTLVGDDTLPDMMLGRLAVNDTAEASAIVNKIIAYEGAAAGDWQKAVLAVADNADTAGNFPQISERLLNDLLPGDFTATRVYYGQTHTDTALTRTAILNAINAGKLIVNYVGHSGVISWADEAIFRTSDFGSLANAGMLPVMLPMTCYDGYYIYPQTGSTYNAIGELITRLDGVGAVASWSPTGLGISIGHDDLDRGFLNAVFRDADGHLTVGQATAAGALRVFGTGLNLDLLDTYLLFGDPATVMPVEAPSGMLGDVNGDALVDSTDALIVLSADAAMDTAVFCPMNCGDVNSDGLVDSTDSLIILSYDAEMAVPFPLGQPGCPSTVTPPAGCGL